MGLSVLELCPAAGTQIRDSPSLADQARLYRLVEAALSWTPQNSRAGQSMR